MGTFSIWHWLIVLAVVLILFGGRGKVSQLMADFGKGLKAFKRSMREDEPYDEQANVTVEPKVLQPTAPSSTADPAKERERAARP